MDRWAISVGVIMLLAGVRSESAAQQARGVVLVSATVVRPVTASVVPEARLAAELLYASTPIRSKGAAAGHAGELISISSPSPVSVTVTWEPNAREAGVAPVVRRYASSGSDEAAIVQVGGVPDDASSRGGALTISIAVN